MAFRPFQIEKAIVKHRLPALNTKTQKMRSLLFPQIIRNNLFKKSGALYSVRVNKNIPFLSVE